MFFSFKLVIVFGFLYSPPQAENVIVSIDNRMEGIAEEVSVQVDYEETSGEKKGKILKTIKEA